MARKSWTNWAENRHCHCNVVRPGCLEELQAEVAKAVRAGRRIRATGGSYSWSPLVENPDTIIVMDRLTGNLGFDGSDPERPTFTVEAGMSIEQLDRFARAQGCTLISPTLFPKPTVGGVIATGSHGTGRHIGNFSDQIEELQIVRADGSLARVSRGDRDYRAAKVALGTLGIVYAARIRVERQYNVHVDKRHVPVRYVLDEFEDLQKSYQFLEMMWFPLQSKMWLYLMNRTESLPTPEGRWTRWWNAIRLAVERQAGSRWIPWVARHAPQLTPVLNSLATRLAYEVNASVQTASDAFHFQKVYPKNMDLSYAVPASHAARAWREAISLVEEYARAELYPVNLALHCRFTGPSDAWLGPDYDRDTCYIEVATAKGTPEWEGFFREMERRWHDIPGARPHWGKVYWRWRELASCYPRLDDFLAVRERWDPDRVFLNEFLEQEVFQLPQRPQAAERPSVGPPAPPLPPPSGATQPPGR